MNIIHHLRRQVEWFSEPTLIVLSPPDYENFLQSVHNMKLDLTGCQCSGMTGSWLNYIPVIRTRFFCSFMLRERYNPMQGPDVYLI